MLRTVVFTGIGYLSGSILFARLFGTMLKQKDVIRDSPDQSRDLQRISIWRLSVRRADIMWRFAERFFAGFLVFAYCGAEQGKHRLAFVLAAPVIGHILPIFYGFRGGKGIAVSFGCLLGLLPEYRPVLILACFFLFFSLVLKITPNYHRTLFTYLCSVVTMGVLIPNTAISLGFSLVAGLIIFKLLASDEQKKSVG